MPICAYCNEDKKLTKEHIWPKCILNSRKYISAHFSLKSNKVHGADYIVKDVCAECNNIILSELDSYFCKLNDSYFQNEVDPKNEIEFKYNYNLLTRALLKIAYNSARGGISNTTILSKTSPYILGKESSINNLIAFLEVLKPFQSVSLKEHGLNIDNIPSIGIRYVYIHIEPPPGDKVLCRVISINSYYFFLFLLKIDMTESEISTLKEEIIYNFNLEGAVCLNKKGIIKIKPCNNNRKDNLYKHILKNYNQFKEFFDKKR